MKSTLEGRLTCEKGGQRQPALALLSEMVAMLELNLTCEKGGQWQPALALLSEIVVATVEVKLTFEKDGQR